MNKAERLAAIIAIVDEHGAAKYQELERRLKVSSMTVRRDISTLETQGKLIKTLGGAQRANVPASLYETNLASRLSSHRSEKRAIAALAVKTIRPGETVYLDGGTTCLELAKMFGEAASNVTVVTNSMMVYLELVKTNNVTILCIGGQHDAASFCLTGPRAEDEAQKYFVDKAFFSTKGFIPSKGTFESSVATFRVKQVIAKQSKEVVLLLDHSKFGQQSLCKVLGVEQINTLITDSRADVHTLEALKGRGIRILVAASKGTQQPLPKLR